VYGRAAIA